MYVGKILNGREIFGYVLAIIDQEPWKNQTQGVLYGIAPISLPGIDF